MEPDYPRFFSGTETQRLVQLIREIQTAPNVSAHTIFRCARRTGLNTTTLKRRFKKQTGSTLAASVRMAALHKALHLLQTTNQSIEEIAEEIGYPWRANFTTAFKKEFSFLPSAVRKQLKQPAQEEKNFPEEISGFSPDSV